MLVSYPSGDQCILLSHVSGFVFRLHRDDGRISALLLDIGHHFIEHTYNSDNTFNNHTRTRTIIS